MIHHVLSLWLVYGLVGGEVNFDRYFAHLLICDTTNIFFCTAWVLRLAGYRDSFVVKVLEALFALGFLFLRGFNISTILIIMYFLPESASLGLAKYSLPLIALLQWFWLAKIFGAIFSKVFSSSSSSSSSKSDKEDKLK